MLRRPLIFSLRFSPYARSSLLHLFCVSFVEHGTHRWPASGKLVAKALTSCNYQLQLSYRCMPPFAPMHELPSASTGLPPFNTNVIQGHGYATVLNRPSPKTYQLKSKVNCLGQVG